MFIKIKDTDNYWHAINPQTIEEIYEDEEGTNLVLKSGECIVSKEKFEKLVDRIEKHFSDKKFYNKFDELINED